MPLSRSAGDLAPRSAAVGAARLGQHDEVRPGQRAGPQEVLFDRTYQGFRQPEVQRMKIREEDDTKKKNSNGKIIRHVQEQNRST